jgi:hypothetical protein
LDLATGDFILFVDADDRLLPGAVPRLLDAIMPQAPDISMFLHQTIQENGKPEVRDNLPAFLSSRLESGAENSISPVGETRRFFDLKNPSERRVSFELAVGNLWAWNGFFRREALGDLRFAPLGRCEDLLFGAQAYCRAQSMLFLPLVGYEYVRRPGSASSRDTFKNCVSAIEAAAGLFETIRLSGFLDQIEDLLFRKIRTLAFGTTLGPLLRLPACERKAAWDCWFRRFKPVFQMLEMNGLGRHALIRFCLNRESRFLVRLLLRLPVLVKAKILNVPGMRRWWLSARRRGTEHRGKECAA